MKFEPLSRLMQQVKSGVFILVFVMLFSISAPGFADTSDEVNNNNRFVHVVVMWFESDATEQQRQRVIDTTRGFAKIPGVIDVSVGEQLRGPKTTEDKFFTIAATVTLDSQQALQGYYTHPIHVSALKSDMLKGIQRVASYDYIDVR